MTAWKSKAPIYLASVTVWRTQELRASIAACPDCFADLHEAGFWRVSTSGMRLRQQRVCWICRGRRESDTPGAPWRGPERRQGIAELIAGIGQSPDPPDAQSRSEREG